MTYRFELIPAGCTCPTCGQCWDEAGTLKRDIRTIAKRIKESGGCDRNCAIRHVALNLLATLIDPDVTTAQIAADVAAAEAALAR